MIPFVQTRRRIHFTKKRLRVGNIYEGLLTTTHSVGAIFALKNLGWRDEQNLVLDKEAMRAATRLLFPDELLTVEQIASKNN